MQRLCSFAPFTAALIILSILDWRVGLLTLAVGWFNRRLTLFQYLLLILVYLFVINAKYNLDNYINRPLPNVFSGIAEVLEVDTNSFSQKVRANTSYGLLVADLAKYPLVSEGDVLEVQGNLVSVDMQDPYQKHYFAEGYYALLEKAQIRNFALNVNKSSPCSGLLSVATYEFTNFLCGITIGEYQLSNSTEDLFKNLGLTHVLSVSGYNVTVIIGLITKLAGRIHRRKLILLTIPVLISYLQLVGGNNIPANRAVLMGIFMLVAQFSGRPNSIWLSLLYANALFFLVNPYVYLSISWQLSVSALAGILLLTDRTAKRLTLIPKVIRNELAVSLAASIATAPVLLIHFGGLSLIAPLANLLIAPFIPLFMAISGIAFLLSFSHFGIAITFLTEPIFEMLIFSLNILNQYQTHCLIGFLLVCLAVFIYHKLYVAKNN